MTRLTAAQARRVAVTAQGFGASRPAGPITRAHLRTLIDRVQILQLDSVSVAVRAHYAHSLDPTRLSGWPRPRRCACS
jgi:uncharacterized protein YcaQ